MCPFNLQQRRPFFDGATTTLFTFFIPRGLVPGDEDSGRGGFHLSTSVVRQKDLIAFSKIFIRPPCVYSGPVCNSYVFRGPFYNLYHGWKLMQQL
jgi:hypothetical protein